MNVYNIAERFVSINGEGRRAGQLAVFLRFGGCNLDCNYCDTAWAKDREKVFSSDTKEELYQYVKGTGIANVTLTGGEPLIQDGILELLRYFSEDSSLRVEIETNGSMAIHEIQALENPPSLTMDYKSPSCGMESHMLMENYGALREKDSVKFVVANLADLLQAKQVMEQYDLTTRCHVFFSPVFGKIDPKEIAAFMEAHQLNGVNLQLQLHKLISVK
jgi:7-carboxy-7-deazaguanine synthase